MSFTRLMLRCSAVAALRDQTWCGDRVFDSDLAPLVEAIKITEDPTDQGRPYCVVYTDDDIVPTAATAIYSSDDRALTLNLEIAVSTVTKGQGNITINFSRTDAGLEAVCDIISAQAIAALITGPKSPWGELFKKMARVMSVRMRRGGVGERGVRFAARRITLILHPLYEQPMGATLSANHYARAFIDLATASSDIKIQNAGTMIKSFLIDTAVDTPEWRQAQAMLGLTTDAALALVVPTAPLPYPEIEEAPLDYSDTDEFVPEMETVVMHDTDSLKNVDVPIDDSGD